MGFANLRRAAKKLNLNQYIIIRLKGFMEPPEENLNQVINDQNIKYMLVEDFEEAVSETVDAVKFYDENLAEQENSLDVDQSKENEIKVKSVESKEKICKQS